MENATQNESGIDWFKIDPSRLTTEDHTYSVTVPRGAKIFAVGWHAVHGMVGWFSAPVSSLQSDEAAALALEVQRLWVIPAEHFAAGAVPGTVYLGTVMVQSIEQGAPPNQWHVFAPPVGAE